MCEDNTTKTMGSIKDSVENTVARLGPDDPCRISRTCPVV